MTVPSFFRQMRHLDLVCTMTAKRVNNDGLREKEWFQVLAILSACTSMVTSGILFSWPSPSVPKIVNDKLNYDITLDEASYFTVLPPLGVITFSFLFAMLSDRIGRKYTLLLAVIPHAASLIINATATSVYLFYVGRFLAGVANACVLSSLPMYIGEVATPKVRGFWGNALSFLGYVGELAINIIGSYTSIAGSAYICLVFPMLFFASFVFMPETPYFYLMKGRIEDARISLQRLRQKQNVEEELSKLIVAVDRQMSESGSWKDVLTIASNRKALSASCFLRMSQQLSGISSFAVYCQYIFLKSGSNISASVSAMIFMGLCTALNLCAGFTLERFGRRRSYFMSLLFCGLILMCVGVYFALDQFWSDEIDVGVVSWIPLAGMISFIVFYSLGLGIVPSLMMSELFSASIKGKCIIIMCIVHAGLVAVVTKIFHLLDSNFGLFAPFLFFSLCCFVSTVLALCVVPETKGKTLEEIQQSFKKNKNIGE